MDFEILDDFHHEEAKEAIYRPATTGKRVLGFFMEYMFFLLISIGLSMVLAEDLMFAIFLFLLIHKDAIGGKSPVKRILKTKVMYIKDKPYSVAKPLRCSFRIWTVWLGILEVIIMLINGNNRRLGDLITNTIVVDDSNLKYQTTFAEDWENTDKQSLGFSLSIYTILFVALFGFL